MKFTTGARAALVLALASLAGCAALDELSVAQLRGDRAALRIP